MQVTNRHHDSGDRVTEGQAIEIIDQMSNSELLNLISVALDELLSRGPSNAG